MSSTPALADTSLRRVSAMSAYLTMYTTEQDCNQTPWMTSLATMTPA